MHFMECVLFCVTFEKGLKCSMSRSGSYYSSLHQWSRWITVCWFLYQRCLNWRWYLVSFDSLLWKFQFNESIESNPFHPPITSFKTLCHDQSHASFQQVSSASVEETVEGAMRKKREEKNERMWHPMVTEIAFERSHVCLSCRRRDWLTLVDFLSALFSLSLCAFFLLFTLSLMSHGQAMIHMMPWSIWCHDVFSTSLDCTTAYFGKWLNRIAVCRFHEVIQN